VLDLRNNPGGLLDQSVAVAGLFLASGKVVSTVGRNPHSFQNFAATAGPRHEALPLAVLVNGGSASASEIVAAALQDAGRAVVIGTSSYGKGTVQTVLRMPNDGELTVTWAKLVTPLGYLLHEHGVVPTVCTAARGGEPPSAAAALEQAVGAVSPRREQLDDAGWQRLRDGCPAGRAAEDVDLQVAHRVLQDPALYGRVLIGPGGADRVIATVRTTH
jgi:carboxyl-terminal processing protease